MDTPDPSAASPRWTDYVRLDQIKVAERNAKLHDDAGITRAIAHHGFVEQPARDERTGRLVAGHGRFKQLLAMHAEGQTPPDGIVVDDDGMWRMPVTAGWSSRSDADAETYLIGSNRLTEKGGVDEVLMTAMLADQADAGLLELTGYDQGDYDAMKALFADAEHEYSAEDFDELAGEEGGDDEEEDGGPVDPWPVVHIRVPPMLAESWKAHLDTYNGDEPQAFAKLLGIDPADIPDV